MAHHNNTPKTVLNAPSRSFGWVWLHTGPNRKERRKSAKATGYKPMVENIPYVKGKRRAVHKS